VGAAAAAADVDADDAGAFVTLLAGVDDFELHAVTTTSTHRTSRMPRS
jgi:hypothetical protein